MPDWTDEFPFHYEVSGFIPFLLRKKILEDFSWHNDVSPSFGVRREKGEHSHEIRLWVDHPFKDQRETGGSRYLVTVVKDDEQVFELPTDDLDEALKELFNQLALWYKGTTPGVFDWMPESAQSMYENEWDDPVEYLEELKKEYLSDPRA